MSEKNKPAHTIRRPGGLKLPIWKKDGEHGTFYTGSPSRSYKDGDQWKETTSFNQHELLYLAKMADEAETWIANEQAKAKATQAPDAEQAGYSDREEHKRAGGQNR